MLSHKFIIKKSKPTDKEGRIFLQIIENRKKHYKSLSLKPIPVRLWDDEKQRVRKNTKIDYKKINDTIDDKLKEFLSKDSLIEQVESPRSQKSFVYFFEEIVLKRQLTFKHGTRIKYEVVLNKLKKFLKTKHQNDLSFRDISTSLLLQFRDYLLKDDFSTNSINHYLKIIKGIINKASKEGFYTFFYNPFNQYSFYKKHIDRKILPTIKEMFRLIDLQFENDTLNKYRDYFLFQVFANGMRVSDLSLLRYSNLVDGRINYKMFKTQSSIDIPLNGNHIKILNKYIGIDLVKISNETTLSGNHLTSDNIISQYLINGNKNQNNQKRRSPFQPPLPSQPILIVFNFQKQFAPLNSFYHEFLISSNIHVLTRELMLIESFLKHNPRNKSYKVVKSYYEVVLKNISELSTKIRKQYIENLNQMGKHTNTKHKFIFPILSDVFYEKTKNKDHFNSIDESCYKELKHKSIVYNRNLKKISEEIGWDYNLTTHTPRHLFTSLLMSMPDVNIYDISKSLGHSDIKVTESYIQSGFNLDKLDKINESIAKLLRH
jgi:integrase